MPFLQSAMRFGRLLVLVELELGVALGVKIVKFLRVEIKRGL